MRKWVEAVLVVALVAAPVSASAARITVTDPWIRSLPGNAAGYFTLQNNEHHPLKLTGVNTTACQSIMLHKTSTESGMASMSDVDQVQLAPAEIVKFEPGGYHLMCMGPKAEISPGKRVTITLEFGDGSTNPVSFAVRNAAGH